MKSTFIDTPNGKFRVRYYKERRKDGHYLAVFPDNVNGSGHLECIATVYDHSPESWAGSSCSLDYLRNKCNRVSRDEVPESLRQRAESFE